MLARFQDDPGRRPVIASRGGAGVNAADGAQGVTFGPLDEQARAQLASAPSPDAEGARRVASARAMIGAMI